MNKNITRKKLRPISSRLLQANTTMRIFHFNYKVFKKFYTLYGRLFTIFCIGLVISIFIYGHHSDNFKTKKRRGRLESFEVTIGNKAKNKIPLEKKATEVEIIVNKTKKTKKKSSSSESKSWLKNYAPISNEPFQNTKFYFYNKMPKCGSTTLHTVLKILAEINEFDLRHIDDNEANQVNKGSDTDKYISALFIADDMKKTKDKLDKIENGQFTRKRQKPLLIVKHNKFINFTQYNINPFPTTFNLVRDPILRWVSAYNFCRGGMKNNPHILPHCKDMTQKQLEMTVEEYIKTDPWVVERHSRFMAWLTPDASGNCEFCRKMRDNWQTDRTNSKLKTSEYIKTHIVNLYHTIGILEELKTSLLLFEKMMPRIFNHVEMAFESSEVGKAIENSKSVKQAVISNSTYNLLARTAFKYEIDVYEFIKRRYKHQVRQYLGNGDEENINYKDYGF